MQVIVRHLERPPLIDRFPPDEPTQTATMTPRGVPLPSLPRPLACRATDAVAMQQLSNAPLPSIRTWRCAPVEQDAFREYFAHQQRAGLGALAELSTPSARLDDELAALLAAGGYDHEIGSRLVRPGPVDIVRDDRGFRDSDSYRNPPVLPPREIGHGPLAHEYDIPDVTFRPLRGLALFPLLIVTAGSLLLHGGGLGGHLFASKPMVAAWGVAIAFVVAQLILAWQQKPFTVTRRQLAQLDRLWVTVNIPVYNEDPAILDRTIYALFSQTRLPDHVQVVDDGSAQDYSEVREWWEAYHPPGVWFSWVRQLNAGKKHAQAVTFNDDFDADIFVTIDSDSALDCCALDEGLKPFADPRIVSVAGLETAFNYGTKSADPRDQRALDRVPALRDVGAEQGPRKRPDQPGGLLAVPGGPDQGNRSRLPRRDVLRRPGHARRRHGADHVRALQEPGRAPAVRGEPAGLPGDRVAPPAPVDAVDAGVHDPHLLAAPVPAGLLLRLAVRRLHPLGVLHLGRHHDRHPAGLAGHQET